MNSILSLNLIYYTIGVIVLYLVYLTLKDKHNPKRYTTALFWFLFGSVFIFGNPLVHFLGKTLGYQIIGLIVIIIAFIAGFGGVTMGKYKISTKDEQINYAAKFSYKLFIPSLAIPIFTVIGVLFLKDINIGGIYLLSQRSATLAALMFASIIALLFAWKITGGNPIFGIQQSRRLIDSVGWAIILPQMLAMLGGIFVASNTGHSVESVVKLFINPDSKFSLVVIYCVGMTLFTMIMGNAFAAFPVMSAGIAIPFLIIGHGANPAAVLAIGMYAGYCGTLMTPMGANFNIVPAALLELKDKYQIIKVQIPSAIAILIANIFLMYFLAF